MKTFNWATIPCQSVLGKQNVFTSQLPKNLELDFQAMDELFSHDAQQPGGERSFREAPVSILNSKKNMSISIFLKHFKRPVRDMMDNIRQGLQIGDGKLKELWKLLPEDSEVERLLSFDGDLSLLPKADQLMVELVKMPGYKERLRTMLLREEFFPHMELVKNSIVVLIKAANELLDSDDLHLIIRLVLVAGNYMNAGGYAGNAVAFRMVSLLKLADTKANTKANRPGMNLLHYVAKQVQGIAVELLPFSSQLGHIGAASKIQMAEVKTDFQREVRNISEVRLCVSQLPDLFQQMETFLKGAEAKLAELDSLLLELEALSHAVAEFFCENPAGFKLEECCSVFHTFCCKFDAAARENRVWETAELRLKQRESVRASAMRDSARSRREPHPLDRNASSLESALHSFLSIHPGGRGMLSRIAGSSTEEEPEVGPKKSRQGRSPEKKHALKNEEEAEETRAATRKEPCYQDGEVPDAPRQPVEASHATPTGTRYQGNLHSPWTDLSPYLLPCSRRGRRSILSIHPGMLSQIVGSPAEEEPEVGPKKSRQGRSPEKKPALKNEGEEAEETRAATRKAPCYQDGEVPDAPRQPVEAGHATPTGTRYQGNLYSPWTILSPYLSPSSRRSRRSTLGRRSPIPERLAGPKQDFGGSTGRLDRCVEDTWSYAAAQRPRSLSVDEARRAPVSGSWLGNLLQSSIARLSRSYMALVTESLADKGAGAGSGSGAW